MIRLIGQCPAPIRIERQFGEIGARSSSPDSVSPSSAVVPVWRDLPITTSAERRNSSDWKLSLLKIEDDGDRTIQETVERFSAPQRLIQKVIAVAHVDSVDLFLGINDFVQFHEEIPGQGCRAPIRKLI